jgi:hypothetical protein
MAPKAQKTRNCFSQPSTSTNSNIIQNDEEYCSNTQIVQNESLSKQEHAHHVSNIVKYILAADQLKVPILKLAISKAVNCQRKNFRAAIKTAEEVLKYVS